MKSLIKSVNFTNLFILSLMAVAIFAPEVAMAQNSQQTALGTIINDGSKFKLAIDLGLLVFAAYQWFMYIANFNPSAAFKDIILPGLITFLAFQWAEVLSWVGLL